MNFSPYSDDLEQSIESTIRFLEDLRRLQPNLIKGYDY
jgi:hypothetical protein